MHTPLVEAAEYRIHRPSEDVTVLTTHAHNGPTYACYWGQWHVQSPNSPAAPTEEGLVEEALMERLSTPELFLVQGWQMKRLSALVWTWTLEDCECPDNEHLAGSTTIFAYHKGKDKWMMAYQPPEAEAKPEWLEEKPSFVRTVARRTRCTCRQ